MSREIDPRDRGERNEPRARMKTGARTPEPAPLSRERQALRERECLYQLCAAERATLADIGRFRSVDTTDLLRYRYDGRRAPFHEDLQRLAAQGLLQERTVWTGGRGKSLTVAVLTPRGRQVVEHHAGLAAGQRVYSGLVKPAEIHHDAAIYRMFQAESAQIRQAGGQVRRVILDYELKRNVYRPLAQAKGLPPLDYARRQAEIAEQNGLKVVRGKILLPDLRIEYVTRAGAGASVDLELATEHYRAGMMRGKAEAGFKMYAPQAAAGRLAAAFDPEFAAQIFSF